VTKRGRKGNRFAKRKRNGYEKRGGDGTMVLNVFEKVRL
jgi:hypothetical protein